MSDELPEGWAWTTLAGVCRSITDGDHQPPPKAAAGIPFITISAMNDGVLRLDKATRFVAPSYLASLKPERRAEVGDVLFSVTGSIGLAALVEAPTPFVFQRHVAILKPNTSCISERFLRYRVVAPDIKAQAEEIATGTAQLTIPLNGLRTFFFGLPPLSEQRRIVAKVETLLGKVNAARDRLAKVPLLLQRFRQSVLASACSGRLTEDWRAERGLADWPTVVLRDHATEFSYGSAAKSSKSGAVPVLRMGNIQDGQLDWADLVFTSDPAEINKYRLMAGDVLFNRTNSPELVGKTAVFRGERDAVYAGYLIRVRCSARLLPEYLNYCLNGPDGRAYCSMVKSDGVSQSNINATKLAEFQFHLPSIDEQREVVRRTERLLAAVSQILERQAKASGAIGDITKSVLLKAFSGELVPTESALARKEGRPFESAAQLLSQAVDQIPPPRIEKRSLPVKTVKTTDEDAIAAAIRSLPVGQLSFDELRNKVPCEYELLRQVVFDLLAESPPALRQVFSERAKAMMLERVGG